MLNLGLHKVQGRVVFDPKSISTFRPWWAIVRVPRNIVEYYRHWVLWQTKEKITTSLWGAHISVVRGEEIPHLEQWNKFPNQRVTIVYGNLQSNGLYYWLDVSSPELVTIRRKLGLPPEPKHGFHLTVGKKV